jgi:hypothetical protein
MRSRAPARGAGLRMGYHRRAPLVADPDTVQTLRCVQGRTRGRRVTRDVRPVWFPVRKQQQPLCCCRRTRHRARSPGAESRLPWHMALARERDRCGIIAGTCAQDHVSGEDIVNFTKVRTARTFTQRHMFFVDGLRRRQKHRGKSRERHIIFSSFAHLCGGPAIQWPRKGRQNSH